jgi:hypothetical protein
VTTTTRGSFGAQGRRPAGAGWITFATVMLGVAGTFNVIDGIVGLARSTFYVAGASYVFSDLRTWSWIVLAVGAVEVAAALAIVRGSEVFRWLGVAAASLNALAQLLAAPGYPLWSVAAFSVDVLVIYALVVYGGKRLATGAGGGAS